MHSPEYGDSKSVAKKEMKEAEIINEHKLDDIKQKYEDSQSFVRSKQISNKSMCQKDFMNFSVDFFMTTISLLQKFYLTSAEMKDDKKISGKKKVEYRRLTSGNNNERIENFHTNPCESD